MGNLLLTVLGSGVAWANPGGVCSGYLVRAGDTSLLVDCGSGVLGRLRAHADPSQLDAVIVSHLHADHFLDLVGLRYGIKYAGLGGPRPLRILLPPGGCDKLSLLGTVLDDNAGFFAEVFALEEYEPSHPVQLDALTISIRRVQHYIPSHALRIEAGGSTLVYSADSAPCAALVEHARGADTLLCEAAMLHLGQDEPDPAKRGHLTAGEAGRVAHDAGVGRLLITHAPLDPDDPGRAAREAKEQFSGPIERVVDGQTYAI
jgi:ribonuclease BN (tRNA processing enzyme)